jgi:hypothetical protein
VVAGEACDDYNALACGSCNADCTIAEPPARALGSINAVAGNLLLDGETFTIGDGDFHVTFEFDIMGVIAANGVQPTHVPVVVKGVGAPGGVDNSFQVASKMVVAINSVSGFLVTASSISATVSLHDDGIGSAGNIPITETVADPGFNVSGMSGGAGLDCPLGVGCSADTDCQSGHCDTTAHTCL